MKRIFKISSLLLFVTVFFASCLEDADSDITYYSDTAITTFSVTNFNTYHTTLSSKGEDSIYRVKEDGKKYKFYIDQNKNEIYNPDSLPVGTDAKHLICAIGTARGANYYIKSMISDSLQSITMSDSLDFTQPRIIKVISLDGKYDRSYTVKVNVHKQIADKFQWYIMGTNEAFANVEDLKLLSHGKDLAAFVKNGETTEVYTSSVTTSLTWDKMQTSFDASAYKNAITFEGKYFILSGGKIYSSEDASAWNEVADAANIVRFAGSDKQNIYALSNEGIMVSSDAAKTWNIDALADEASLLPMNDISFATTPLKTNKNVSRLTIIGNRNVTTDKYAFVWNKLTEYVPTTEKHMWNYVEQTSKETFRLPSLKGLQVIAYADGLYAMGGETFDGSVKAFSQIYFSKDGGITWLNDYRFSVPLGFLCKKSFTITTDEEHNIWVICGDSGRIWRGRLNGLAWENK